MLDRTRSKASVDRALAKFRKAAFKYGDVVPKDWLWESFGLRRPEDDDSYADAKEANLQYLEIMNDFAAQLLTNDKIFLRNRWGEGYELVQPAEQADVAVQDFADGFGKLMHRAKRVVMHVNEAGLSDEERSRRSDALARLVDLENLSKGRLKPRMPF